MSDEAADTSTDRAGKDVPGSGAGDAAHTTQIPRIERHDDPVAHTDKGRPRPSTAAKPVAKTTAAKPAAKTPAKKPAAAKPAAAKAGVAKTPTVTSGAATEQKSADEVKASPALTASDYARTTSQSASSTAVIPAVKAEREAPSTPQTVTPSTEQHQRDEQSAPMEESTGGRAATLRLSYIEPWSVTRMAFAISVAMMIVAVVATTIFWVVLDVTGVWDQIDGSVTTVLSDDSSSFRITDYLGFTRLVGLTLVLSALNVVIATVLATIAAHLYNLAAQLLGGFEVTYTSKD